MPGMRARPSGQAGTGHDQESKHKNQRGGVMRTIIILAIVFGIASALELAFGINDTGEKFALILLVWCCTSIPLSLVIGRFFAIVNYDDERQP